MSLAALAADPVHPALDLLARETRVARGPVQPLLEGREVPEIHWLMSADRFVFNAERGVRFLYRRGEGITLDRPAGADPRDVDLWLNGTVYAAVAAMNGLFPLHASAVAHDGRVFAFTGPAGAGKSTLVAALGRAGFAHFCDDTLLLDLSGDESPTCLPGHKRLKLWPEGVALAGVEAGEIVGSDYPKHFAEPERRVSKPLPLAELNLLDRGDACAFEALGPGERIALLDDEHHTARLWQAARGWDRAARFAGLSAVARRISMNRFVRPFDAGRFAAGVEAADRHIRGARH